MAIFKHEAVSSRSLPSDITQTSPRQSPSDSGGVSDESLADTSERTLSSRIQFIINYLISIFYKFLFTK
jgi:hypothetical protein